jgi:prepilin-type N-terminal cleavage/methylation domain-containing protein
MRKFWNNQKGVTMIEVLVTIAILAIVVTPCLSAFVMAQRGNVKAAETQQAYTAAANLMEELKGGNPKSWDSNVFYDSEKNITAFRIPQEEEGLTYYIVTIYEGDWTGNDVVLPTEYLLKGVIVP